MKDNFLDKDTVDLVILALNDSKAVFRKVFEDGGECSSNINKYLFGYDAAIKTIDRIREMKVVK